MGLWELWERWPGQVHGIEVSVVAPPSPPRVATISAPLVSLEVVAIAAGVFSLVVSLLWLAFPPELIWLLVIGLLAKRSVLADRGHDLMFARARHPAGASRLAKRAAHGQRLAAGEQLHRLVTEAVRAARPGYGEATISLPSTTVSVA